MRQIEKLVQQIREALAEPGDLGAIQFLASEYAHHCQEANRRLGQCAEMIARGNKYQTLQLAETRPALLELVTTLSFDRQHEWRTLCKELQIPVPEKINEKEVRLLNHLYATGVPPTEEMWKVFRASIAEADDLKSLTIVRTILNRDATDADARREMTRLEKKIVRGKLADLKDGVQRGDGAAVVRLMSEIEAVTSETPADETWGRAFEVRRLFYQAEAGRECKNLLAQAQAAQDAGEWRAALGRIAQVQDLSSRHDLVLPAEQERSFFDLQVWAQQKETEHAQEQSWQQTLGALEAQLKALAEKDLARPGRPLPELRAEKALLAQCWSAVEAFQREPSADLVARMRRALATLRVQSDRIQRQRQALLTVAAAVVLCLAAAVAMFLFRSSKASDYAQDLNAALAAHQVLPVAKLLEELRSRHPALLHKAALEARIAEADAWLADQHTAETALEAAVARLKSEHVDQGFQAPPEAIEHQFRQARQLLAPVAPDLRAPAEARLVDLEHRFAEFLGVRRTAQQGRFREVLEKAEALANDGLDFKKQPPEVLAALAEITPLVTELDRINADSMESLKPAESDLARLVQLSGKVHQFQAETAKVAAAEQACDSATALDAYLAALEGYATMAFLQSPAHRNAQVVRETVKGLDEFTATLLLPGDPVAWAHFKAHRGQKAFYPPEVGAAEKPVYLGLRDDDNLRTIYRYECDGGNPYIYAQEKLSRTEATLGSANHKRVTMTGRVFMPNKSRSVVNFATETFTGELIGAGHNGALPEKEQLSPESQFFAKLGLALMVDDVVMHYRRPVLELLDTVLAGQADPLFKAYLHTQLLELAKSRPAEWGLQWTSANAHARRLAALTAPGLASGDWMSPTRQGALAKPLTEYYSGLKGTSYAKQAAVISGLVEQAYAAGLTYAGYLQPGDQLRLVGEGNDGGEWWGFAREPLQPTLLFRRVAGSPEPQKLAEPLPLTPLFFCKLDRRKALADACKAADIAPAHPSIAGALPPFFAQK